MFCIGVDTQDFVDLLEMSTISGLMTASPKGRKKHSTIFQKLPS